MESIYNINQTFVTNPILTEHKQSNHALFVECKSQLLYIVYQWK